VYVCTNLATSQYNNLMKQKTKKNPSLLYIHTPFILLHLLTKLPGTCSTFQDHTFWQAGKKWCVKIVGTIKSESN
jgi:hypothetical protein